MAGEEQGTWDALAKRNAFWLQSFWFVRGVMGTMALVALIPQVTELEQIEVLRALYALIIGWDSAMAWVGRMIGKLPLLPELPAALVSALVFFGSISVPMILGTIARFRHSKLSLPLVLSSLSVILMAIMVPLFYAAFLTMQDHPLYSQISLPDPGDKNILYLVILGISFWIFTGLYAALRYVPGFRQGLFFTLGVIATITIGYNIGTTDFSDWINATVCAELGISPGDCAPAD